MQNQQISVWIAIILCIFGVLFLGFMFYSPKNSDKSTVSTYSWSSSPALSQIPTGEPEVDSWVPFTNDTYLFSMNVPEGWKSQDFQASHPKGGTLIAFSPNDLPCDTCTYIHDGYFSLKIYNAKTDPQAYADFQTKMKNVGKNPEIQGVYIDQKVAELSGSSVAVENQGWVYEFTLDANPENKKLLETKIFQKWVTSFRFTGLIFK